MDRDWNLGLISGVTGKEKNLKLSTGRGERWPILLTTGSLTQLVGRDIITRIVSQQLRVIVIFLADSIVFSRTSFFFFFETSQIVSLERRSCATAFSRFLLSGSGNCIKWPSPGICASSHLPPHTRLFIDGLRRPFLPFPRPIREKCWMSEPLRNCQSWPWIRPNASSLIDF